MKVICKTLFMVFFFVAGKAYSQDFVYTPRNPAFGGNPYNYSWLLSSAQAQNETKSKKTTTSTASTSSNTLSNFSNSLKQQILSQLAAKIVAKQFGESTLTAGTYILGDYQIVIDNQSDGLNINIVDKSTGSSTTVQVPYF